MDDGSNARGATFGGGDDADVLDERYRALVDLVEGGLFRLDGRGRFVDADDDFLSLTGHEKEAVLGEHVSTLLGDGDGGTVEGAVRELRDGAGPTVESVDATIETADGGRVAIELRLRALSDDGSPGGILGLVEATAPEPDADTPVETPLEADETTTSVLEEADVGVFILDDAFDVAWVDSTAAGYFGVDQAATIGRNKRELVESELTDRVVDGETFAETVLATYDDNSYVERFECRVRGADGEARWLEHRSRPIETGRYAGGRVELYYDVSEQHRRATQLQRLNEAVREWLGEESVEAVAELVCDDVRDVLGMEINGVFRHDAEAEVLRPVAWTRAAEDLFGEVPTFEAGEGIAWRVFESGEAEVYDDVRDAPDVYNCGTPIRSEVALPLGEHGVLEIGSTDRAAFDETDLMLAGIVASTLEVTFDRIDHQRRLEARKAELETELGAILERVTDAFYAVDEEFRFTHVNERTEELLRHSEAELLGESLWSVFPEAEEVETVREAFRTAMDEQRPTSYEFHYETLDLWVEANLYPSESGISVYFRDITERKERERALEESNERLEQFAYAASHDLQEPLRMISSYLKLLERRHADDLDEDAREFVEFAVDGAERMREMIDGLLAYSRVERRGDPFEPVDLEAVLADVREDLQLTLAESGADLEVDSLPTVRGDPSQLRQVFQNLVENAVEYSGDEPPRIRVSAEPAARGPAGRSDAGERSADRSSGRSPGEDGRVPELDGEAWTVAVADEGIGIDPEDADRVFEIFQRLHSREEHPGTGIGLALCERIVERHDGDIWVESEPGEGATFYVTLPAAQGR